MKNLYILLTKTTHWTSEMVYFLCNGGYTHASLALEEDPDLYYTFNFRGFATETIEKHRRKGVNHSRRYTIRVSEESYTEIREMLASVEANRDNYAYTKLGLICCFLHIPFRWKRHYFCSQFVAELLARSGSLPLGKSALLPNHLMEAIERQGGYQLELNVV